MQLESGQLLQRLKPLFQENFERFGELGTAVSVWQNGKPIIDLYGGFRDVHHEKPWAADTLVLVWSATKGIGSACVLHALQENKIDISQRVKDAVRLLAAKFCETAQSRFLDRPSDKGKFPRGNHVRCEKRQAA